MRGRIAARSAAYDLSLYGAWQTERFAREEKLKPLARYLRQPEKRGPATPAARGAEMLATFTSLAGAGVPLKIRRISA